MTSFWSWRARDDPLPSDTSVKRGERRVSPLVRSEPTTTDDSKSIKILTRPPSTTATTAVGLHSPSSVGGLRCSRCEGGENCWELSSMKQYLAAVLILLAGSTLCRADGPADNDPE